MTRIARVRPEFVASFPTKLDDGVLYVSMQFASACHRCCCGCGNEVVTPFTPTDWMMTFDGETVSLDPSIGNWSFACRSHYWIRRNTIRWAPSWSRAEVDSGRARDRIVKEEQFPSTENGHRQGEMPTSAPTGSSTSKPKSWLVRLARWLRKRTA